MTAARLSKILYTRAIRGVIIAPLLRARGHLSLDWRHLAAATISFIVVKPDLHRTSHFHHTGMILALRRLKHLGYRRVGLANLVDQIERVNHGWLAGYLVYSHGQRQKDRIPPLLQKGWNEKQFAEWVEKCKPDAVVSNTQDPFHSLTKLGYRVPEDIGYACLDRLRDDDPWAGIDQQPRIVGASVVDLVSAQLWREASSCELSLMNTPPIPMKPTSPHFSILDRPASSLCHPILRRVAGGLCGVIVLISGQAAWAADISWSSTAGSTMWSEGTNWLGGTAPADRLTTDIALFNQTSNANQPPMSVSTSVGGFGLAMERLPKAGRMIPAARLQPARWARAEGLPAMQARTEDGGDGILSIRIYSTTPGTQRLVTFGTRENSQTSNRPVLQVTP